MSDWNHNIIEEFRGNKGVVGGVFEGKPLLLLHTVAQPGQAKNTSTLLCTWTFDGYRYVFCLEGRG